MRFNPFTAVDETQLLVNLNDLLHFTDKEVLHRGVTNIPLSKQASIPYKLENITINNFLNYPISLKVNKVLKTESHITGSNWQIS